MNSNRSEPQAGMQANDVLALYKALETNGIPIWIDGGWCVDALLGKQTREHPDLDIAVERSNAQPLRELLEARGFHELPRDDSSEWNYVMADNARHAIDVHVFEYDENGNNLYGVKYPMGSLTGTGSINGSNVRCIAPEWMFKFKTAYAPQPKDRQDLLALSEKYGFEVPPSHC